MKGLKIALLIVLILLLLAAALVLYLNLSGQMELLRGILPDFLLPKPPLPALETLARPVPSGTRTATALCCILQRSTGLPRRKCPIASGLRT